MARFVAILLCMISLFVGYAPALEFETAAAPDANSAQLALPFPTSNGVARAVPAHQLEDQSRKTNDEMKIAFGGLVALLLAAYFFVQRQRNVDEVYQEE